MSNRPAATEARYIALVPEDDIIPAMEAQTRETERLLRSISEQKATFRYAPDKWTIKTLVRHFTDTERIFSYRILAIARGEKQPLPGFEQQDYAKASAADERKFSDLVDEYRAVRVATLSLLRGLPSAAWDRIGTASDKPISVRAIAFNTLGHERHHLKVLREKYGVT